MAYSASGPVSAALFARLNVSSLKGSYPSVGAGCIGGVVDAVPQPATFPILFYEVSTLDIGGLGLGPDVAQCELRLHVFSTYTGMSECQRIMREAIRLLRYQQPACTGYSIVAINRPIDEVPLPFELINNVAVRELVTLWNVYADEGADAPPGQWVQGGFFQ